MVAYELIVVGASWGGLGALERLLRGLPADFPVPIVIAQHRAAMTGLDQIGPLLTRVAGRAVREAEDKDPLEPGAVYVAPADYHLLVEHGSVALSTEGPVHYSRPSIDVLFESAADAYGEHLIGVILTGMNNDGAHGITRIRRRGGFTIAEDPATAEKPAMPEAAIATGAVERVLSADAIPPLLVELTGAQRAQGTAA